MTHVKNFGLFLTFAALAFVFLETGLLVRDTRRQVPVIAKSLLSTLATVNNTAMGITKSANSIVARVEVLGDSLDDHLDKIDRPLAQIGDAAEKLGNVKDDTAKTLADLSLTIRDLRPQLLGLIGGWKVTGGEVAQTAREIRRATPELLDDAKKIAGHTEQLTKPRWYHPIIKAVAAAAIILKLVL